MPVAVRRAMRRTRVKETRSGSRSAASAARVIKALSAWWTSSQAQISWWTSSGRWTAPGFLEVVGSGKDQGHGSDEEVPG